MKGNRRVFVETDIGFVLVEPGFTGLDGFANVQSWDVWTHGAMNGIDAIVGATRSVLVNGESATGQLPAMDLEEFMWTQSWQLGLRQGRQPASGGSEEHPDRIRECFLLVLMMLLE